MANKKYYAVLRGRSEGIFPTWDACRLQVQGYPGAVFKSFSTREEAEAYLSAAPSATSAQVDVISLADTLGETECIAYVDGSYQKETGAFSYGMVVILPNGEEIYDSQKYTDSPLASMRNVAGEIRGAEAAMRYALTHGITKLYLFHDYQGIAAWCDGSWEAKQEGTRAYRDFYRQASQKVAIHFIKVKGHSADHYNDLADQLAGQALRQK